jgi:hypothetical protein
MPREHKKASAALSALVALLLAGPGGANAIDPQLALDALRFPGDTRTRVEAGRFVEVALPTRSDRDLNVGIAFLVARQSPAALARTVRKEKRVLHADPNLIAYGEFKGEGTVAELEGLRSNQFVPRRVPALTWPRGIYQGRQYLDERGLAVVCPARAGA